MTLATLLSAQVSPATGSFHYASLLVLLPLLGAAVLLLGGRRTNTWGHLLGVAAVLGSFVVAASLFFAMVSRPSESRSIVETLYSGISVGGFSIPIAFRIDPLTICFLLLITGVGSLIHIYSVGYMEHDPNRRRFFGYLNLFIAAMLVLVLADNYALLYVGWEGVGLASYLLIGFYQERPSAATAAKKAFIVNRVGDLGLFIAIMVMFVTFGTVSFDGVFAGVSHTSSTTLNAIGLLLLLGACGKSAQVPLQSWLLDAMEGPTPVSALIHAATMVTAGVYLVARSGAIFSAASIALTAVAIVGTVTLIFGAVIGSAMDDIKKALAGSTMSQIGYMILGVGLGTKGYALGISHLLSHGFFKAGLFLGAGAVMHAMSDRLDMRRFGGLRKFMPITSTTFLLAYLAIIGIPPFSGFFTKDPIIDAAYNSGGYGWIYGVVGQVTAGLTAFYMTRIVAMTFFGPKRWEEDAHPHEAPKSMTIPQIILAVGSVGLGGLLMVGNRLPHFLAPIVGEAEAPNYLSVNTFVTLGLVLIGAGYGWYVYARNEVPLLAPAGGPLTVAARKSLYGDALNEAVFMRPGQYLTRLLVFTDNRIVDGAVNGTAALFGGLSTRARKWQNGFARSYALSMLGGAVVIAAALILVRR
ncbi:MAG: NADH-quinone oxidoreductase subunit L [Actinomycetes bacterium]